MPQISENDAIDLRNLREEQAVNIKTAREVMHLMAMGYTPYQLNVAADGQQVWLRFQNDDPMNDDVKKSHILAKWSDMPRIQTALMARGYKIDVLKLEKTNRAEYY